VIFQGRYEGYYEVRAGGVTISNACFQRMFYGYFEHVIGVSAPLSKTHLSSSPKGGYEGVRAGVFGFLWVWLGEEAAGHGFRFSSNHISGRSAECG